MNGVGFFAPVEGAQRDVDRYRSLLDQYQGMHHFPRHPLAGEVEVRQAALDPGPRNLSAGTLAAPMLSCSIRVFVGIGRPLTK